MKLELTLKFVTEIDGIYNDSMEDQLLEEFTEGMPSVLDLSEECMLFTESIELVSIKYVK